MKLDLDPSDLAPIVEAAVLGVIAKRDDLGDRIGFPEQEAARLIGCRSYVLRDARRRGEISGRRIGRSVFYSRRALIAWLEGGDK
jgi:hypothetical protein